MPPKGKTVSITGAIRSPAYFEVNEKDDIKSLINYAGDVGKDAKNTIYIYRNNKPNIITNINNDTKLTFVSGDSLVIPKIFSQKKIITVSIDNRLPYEIPWMENINYNDILNSGDLNIDDILKIELVRKINQNNYEKYFLENYDGGDFLFKPNDYLIIHLDNKIKKLNTVTVKGFVESPGVYPLTGQYETLNSIIDRSGGLLSNSNFKCNKTGYYEIWI